MPFPLIAVGVGVLASVTGLGGVIASFKAGKKVGANYAAPVGGGVAPISGYQIGTLAVMALGVMLAYKAAKDVFN